jgi:alcohol dehydrogenase YqhD (iron-dependent ADH family)
MNGFVYNIPTKIYFGTNQMQHLGPELKACGQRVLLVYGGGSIKRTGLYDRILREIDAAGLTLSQLPGVEPNPRVTSVSRGAAICREQKIDVILAVGGGSVIDCSKVIAAAANYDGDAWDIVTRKVPCPPCLPVITILTNAATGSEMDPGCVISNEETKEKVGVYTKHPKVSFLDPTNTFSVGKKQTACGCADILSHVMEVYFSRDYSMDMIDGFMESMMRAVLKYAPIAMAEPENYEARANLMWTASWAINGLIEYGKTQRWLCHPIEHELSAIYDINHGLGLAILTPKWLSYALSAETAPRFRQFAVNVLGLDAGMDALEAGKAAVKALEAFFYGTLGLESSLSQIGIDGRDFDLIAERICRNGPLNAFRVMEKQDIVNVLNLCL